MTQGLIERNDRWVLPVQGRVVTRCLVDHAFGFEVSDERVTISFRIEGAFGLLVDGDKYQLIPDSAQGPAALGPALRILHKGVEKAVAYKDGRLLVAFQGGDCVSVLPDPAYEAWEVRLSDGGMLVSLPGGDLAVWESVGAPAGA